MVFIKTINVFYFKKNSTKLFVRQLMHLTMYRRTKSFMLFIKYEIKLLFLYILYPMAFYTLENASSRYLH